ncbi:MAG TPA: dihydroorotate dehydrogenase electron transfer subunit [Planctomycetaceae bacterium]|nr:dihydroorotate dehydrogenase electron transfer subunit [Planctomycetaceae bacterium]
MELDQYGTANRSAAVHTVATVVEQSPMAADTFRMRLRCPDIARRIVPGQFFMLREPNIDDPLLGRPFALFDVYGQEGADLDGVEIGYLVLGKMTRRMANWQAGKEVEIWGPLGNGFPVPNARHLMMVAGGIGQTPFLAVAREALGRRPYGHPPRICQRPPTRVTLCYGVRTAALLAGVEEFERLGVEVRLATDDGSRGHHGFVTELLEQAIDRGDRPDAIYCCGPEPMIKAVSAIARRHNLPCWLSLETPMACGIGACFSCVVKVRVGENEWDYRRACVDGPVFRADQILF